MDVVVLAKPTRALSRNCSDNERDWPEKTRLSYAISDASSSAMILRLVSGRTTPLRISWAASGQTTCGLSGKDGQPLPKGGQGKAREVLEDVGLVGDPIVGQHVHPSKQ